MNEQGFHLSLILESSFPWNVQVEAPKTLNFFRTLARYYIVSIRGLVINYKKSCLLAAELVFIGELCYEE
jgi:hypothetical protein